MMLGVSLVLCWTAIITPVARGFQAQSQDVVSSSSLSLSVGDAYWSPSCRRYCSPLRRRNDRLSWWAQPMTAAFVVSRRKNSLSQETLRRTLYATSSSDGSENMLATAAVSDSVITNDELERIFQQYSDSKTSGGSMTRTKFIQIPYIQQLLMDDDLLDQDDVDEVWQKYTKEADGEADFKAFVLIYREIDDLFEDDEEDRDEGQEIIVSNNEDSSTTTATTTTTWDDEADTEDAETREELISIFQIIASKSSASGDDAAAASLLLLSRESLREWDEIETLIVDGMLEEEEFEELWEKTPKTPQGNLDLDGFLKFNALVDDLFDFDDTLDEDAGKAVARSVAATSTDDDDDDNLFRRLAGSSELVNKNQLLSKWDELKEMISDGDVLSKEFDEIFDSSLVKSKDASALDEEAFNHLKNAIDDLFEEEDYEGEEDDEGESLDKEPTAAQEVEDDETNLFNKLAGQSGLLSREDLSKKWGELKEMLNDGDISQQEFEQLYASSLTKSKDVSLLDESAFNALRVSIDDLFEDDEDEEETTLNEINDNQAGEEKRSSPGTCKSDLLRALTLINDASNKEDDERRLPCGLESTEAEQKLILNLVNLLLQEEDDSNLVSQTRFNEKFDGTIGSIISTKDVAGSWELLYTSSSAMKFNKGLSGLGGSFPNGKFAGLIQKLSASTLLPDVEYKERIEVPAPAASFDVTVNGNWELRPSVSLFSGEKSVVLALEPDRVRYGPTSTKADHWKSLGPTNMLDLVYLDDDLRIMKGSTSMDTILIFQRI